MKTYSLAVISALALACFAAPAFSQTCASPIPLTTAQSANGNTCSGDNIGGFCGGVTPTGLTDVYSYVAGAGGVSGNITVTPSGTYNVALGVVSGGADCTAALSSNCNGASDSQPDGSATPAETFDLTQTGTAGTTYYLLVTSLSGVGANNCGAYSLTMGTLPVKLQDFSVQ